MACLLYSLLGKMSGISCCLYFRFNRVPNTWSCWISRSMEITVWVTPSWEYGTDIFNYLYLYSHSYSRIRLR